MYCILQNLIFARTHCACVCVFIFILSIVSRVVRKRVARSCFKARLRAETPIVSYV